MPTATYIVDGRVLGQGPAALEQVHSSLEPREGLAYFCEHCGEVWARVVVPGQLFRVISISCAKHPRPYPSDVAGSLWLIWDKRYNDSLPPAVMQRELALHLVHYDKWKETYHEQV